MGTKAEFRFLTELNQIVEAYPEAVDLMPDAGDPDAGAKVQAMGEKLAALEYRVNNLPSAPRRCKRLHKDLLALAKLLHRAAPLAQRMIAAQGVKKNILAGRLIAIWRLAKRANRRLKRDAIQFDEKYGHELVE